MSNIADRFYNPDILRIPVGGWSDEFPIKITMLFHTRWSAILFYKLNCDLPDCSVWNIIIVGERGNCPIIHV